MRAARAWQRIKDAAGRLAGLTRAHPLAMSFLWVGLFCAFSYAALDRPLAHFFRDNLAGHGAGFFHVVTELGRAEWYYGPLIALFLWFRLQMARARHEAEVERLRRRSWVALYPLFTLAASGLVVTLAKYLFGRFRPQYLFDGGQYGLSFFNAEWSMGSFPSGHAQAIWAVMACLLFMFPRYDLMWITLGLLVAASRVALGMHYLSDTVMGAYAAIACAILIRKLYAAHGIDLRIRLDRDAPLRD